MEVVRAQTLKARSLHLVAEVMSAICSSCADCGLHVSTSTPFCSSVWADRKYDLTGSQSIPGSGDEQPDGDRPGKVQRGGVHPPDCRSVASPGPRCRHVGDGRPLGVRGRPCRLG
jgi:hypothetical protein